MTLTIPAEVRAKAEIYHGDAAGQEKTRLLLQETGLPSGLLPLRDIIECGYVEETGFVWLKQRRKVDHYFAKAGRHVTYGAEVSAVAELGRLKKITGVKAKEMLLWVALHEICVDDPPTGKLHCKAIGGLSRSFPVDAFEAEDRRPVAPRGGAGGRCGGGVASREVGGAAAKVEVGKEEEGEKKEEVAAEKANGKDAPVPAAAAAAEEESKAADKDAAAAAVDKVEEKLKEMSTGGDQVVHAAEAVAAKN